MTPAPRREFAAALARLDAESLARLTADLWAARGYATERDGRRVVVCDAGEERTLVAHDAAGTLGRVVPGYRRAPPRPGAVGADAVVTNGTATGPGVTGAADLRRMLLYAVPPATGDDLCRRHLGTPARRERRERRERGGWGAARRVVAVTLALVAVVALATGAPVGERVTAGTGLAAERGAAERGTATANGSDAFPPGVDADGVRDADALAAAHVEALRGQPYAWTVTYHEYYNGINTVLLRQYTTVAGPRQYASRVWGSGEPTGTVGLVVGTTAYANGSVRYEAVDGTVTRRPLPAGNADAGAGGPRDRFAGRAGRLVAWYLSTRESTVERVGPDRVRIRATDDPWGGTTGETTTAVVRDDGLVLELRREHGRSDSNVTVEVAFRYRALGTATVRRPSWVPDGNGTDGGGYDPPSPSDVTAPRRP